MIQAFVADAGVHVEIEGFRGAQERAWLALGDGGSGKEENKEREAETRRGHMWPGDLPGPGRET